MRALLFLSALLLCYTTSHAADALRVVSLTVNGVQRQALVHAPAAAKEKPSPLVFGFHGHGGSMQNAARSFHLHTVWPEAIVIYPQGLNTPGKLTDPEGKKTGWQSNPGHMEDRDLHFFDAILAEAKKTYKVDVKRIYSTGHSNGGSFTYLLWAKRPEVFAAMAPSASAALKELPLLTPKPVLHIAGENDELVKYAWQSKTIDYLRKLNQCSEGKAWAANTHCTEYASALGCPVITALHAGGHKYPEQAPAAIVLFFQQHQRK